MKHHHYYLLLVLWMPFVSLEAQDFICYESSVAIGKQAFYQGNYEEAIEAYFAAYDCVKVPPVNNLEILIRKAQDARLRILNHQRAAAQNELIIAQAEVKTAQELANEKTIQAQWSDQRALSSQLALLADVERNKSNFSEALALSYLALEISDSTNRTGAMLSFAKVVKDSFLLSLPFTGELEYWSAHPAGIQFIDEAGYHFWSEGDSTKTQTLKGFNRLIYYDENRLALSKDSSNSVFLYAFQDNSYLFQTILEGHKEGVYSLTANEEFFLTSSRDNSAILWDIAGNEIGKLAGHEANVYEGIIVESGELITRSADGTVRFYDKSHEVQSVCEESLPYPTTINKGLNHPVIAIGTALGNVILCNISGEIIRSWKSSTKSINELVVTREAQPLVVVFSRDSTIEWRNLEGKVVSKISNLSGYHYLEDSQELISWHPDYSIKHWSANGKLLSSYVENLAPIAAVQVNPNYPLILSTDIEGTVLLKSIDGELLLNYASMANDETTAFFSGRGNYIVQADKAAKRFSVFPHPSYILALLKEKSLEGFQQKILNLKQTYKIN